jgi:hypothetical protein
MPILGDCAHCGKERSLKYARSTMCSSYQCQRAAAKAVAAGKAARRNDSGSVSIKAAPVFWVQVLSVHAGRDFDPGLLKGKAARNAVASDDFVLSLCSVGLQRMTPMPASKM